MDNLKKRCSKCGEEKTLDCFVKGRGKDGRRPDCKDCRGKKSNKIAKNPTEVRTCKQCGSSFKYKPGGKNLKTGSGGLFCSESCRWDYVRENKKGDFCNIYLNVCVVCGVVFVAKRPDNLNCSQDCQRERNRSRTLKRDMGRKEVRSVKCEECGEMFITEYGNKRRNFCSDKCLKKKQGRVGKAKRRARLRGAERESVDPLLVFARDRYVCRLCGKKTRKEKRGTAHQLAPELDHIVPLSRGGGHTYKNTQCTCRSCNSNKGDRLLGQLRLC